MTLLKESTKLLLFEAVRKAKDAAGGKITLLFTLTTRMRYRAGVHIWNSLNTWTKLQKIKNINACCDGEKCVCVCARNKILYTTSSVWLSASLLVEYLWRRHLLRPEASVATKALLTSTESIAIPLENSSHYRQQNQYSLVSELLMMSLGCVRGLRDVGANCGGWIRQWTRSACANLPATSLVPEQHHRKRKFNVQSGHRFFICL